MYVMQIVRIFTSKITASGDGQVDIILCHANSHLDDDDYVDVRTPFTSKIIGSGDDQLAVRHVNSHLDGDGVRTPFTLKISASGDDHAVRCKSCKWPS